MLALLRVFLVTLLAMVGGAAAAAPHLAMRLVAETATPGAGSTVTVAIDTRPQPGWHGYWSNPGDAGLPATLRWTLPAGATAAPAEWPVPDTLIVAGLMNYVYERPYAPLVGIALPPGLARGTRLPIRLHLSYLVCTRELCVPEEQTLATELVIGDGGTSAATRTAFDAWRRAIPRPLGSTASFQREGELLRIAVPYPAGAALEAAYLFPAAPGSIEPAAPQRAARDGDRVIVSTRGAPAAPFEALLRIGRGRGLMLKAVAGEVPAPRDPGGWAVAALVAFAGAVLGGLILNVMPCVFPILSLKAIGLARAGGDERAARGEALAYTSGVVLVCLALGSAILALRAGGAAVGWAFQLQDPRMILVLLVLSVVIALNLSGLFEASVPRFAGGRGAGGAFATGALAAFVATPCSGPFMGAALGAALVLPWPAALAVFGGLGIGLALPFLLIGFVPALRRRLPRPGAWMDRLRRVLAVPMWLTALGLAWLLGRQAGVEGMTLGLGAALLAGVGLWIGGRRQAAGKGLGWAAALVVLSLGAAPFAARAPARVTAATDGAAPFSEPRLAALRGQRRPVFAYFTADWCLSCKVNEKAAIERESVRTAWRRNGVAVLVGDWTDGDPALGRFIQAHQRAGVPLYLYYPPGGSRPRLLPQVLTPAMLEALGR